MEEAGEAGRMRLPDGRQVDFSYVGFPGNMIILS